MALTADMQVERQERQCPGAFRITVNSGMFTLPRGPSGKKASLLAMPRALNDLVVSWWSNALFPECRPVPAGMTIGMWVLFTALIVAASALLFSNLSYPLIEPDEARYAEIGREMLSSGDWIVPTLNGKPYFDKPPMFYWLIAGSFQLFGTNETAARHVPAAAAFLTLLVTFAFGRRLVGARAALLAVFMLAVMTGFVHCGRFLILDGVLTLFVTLALFAAHEAVCGERLRWSWWLTAAFSCALGVLTKGPVALMLVVPPIVGYAWLNRHRARPSLTHWCAALALVSAVTAPWFLAICLRSPEFAREFFIDHHLKRFFAGHYHDRPIWFYAPVLLIGCMPWTPLLFPLAHFLFARSANVRALRSPALGFLVLWASWCVLFFSLSRGKLPPYILPAFPAIALLLGRYLENVLAKSAHLPVFELARTSVPRSTFLLASVIWLLINHYSLRQGFGRGAVGLWIGTGICLSGSLAMGIWGRKIPTRLGWLLCSMAGAFVVIEAAHIFVPAWSLHRSIWNQPAEIVQLMRDRTTAIACCGPGSCSLPFSLNRDNVRTFDSEVELDELLSFLRQPRALLIVPVETQLETIRELLPIGSQIVKVTDGIKARFVLIANRPSAEK